MSASRGPQQSGHPLLSTKLFAPRLRGATVPRPRLYLRLREAVKCPLALVSAPAGFGKSTLVAAWHESAFGDDLPLAWLSLDTGDGEPVRFWTYFVAALQKVAPGVGEDLLAFLHAGQAPAPATCAALLANALADLQQDTVLILDDLHLVVSPPVYEGLSLLIDRLPPAVHLVILTRVDPPLPLARWRARGVVAELRAADLRFGADEASAYLRLAVGPGVGDEDAAVLAERTEGWIAGLQMAALSLHGRSDVRAFVRSFAGTHRYILDFLVEEVLSREPGEVQSFLLRTSPLERFTAPLCDAVTGEGNGEAMLRHVEQANLFLVPLDDDRQWYRYHHLFAELLRARLHQAGESVAELHIRAARWYGEHGYWAEAMSHALAAPDLELAADLVARCWLPVGHSGQTSTVLRWLRALPEATVAERPWLSTAYAWLLYLTGNLVEAAPHLANAQRALDRDAEAGVAAIYGVPLDWVRVGIVSLQSHLHRHNGDIAGALASAREALALVGTGQEPRMALYTAHAFSAYGHAQREAGNTTEAVAAFLVSVPRFKMAGNQLGVGVQSYYLARAFARRGELERAAEVCRESLAWLTESGAANLPAAGILRVGLGEVLLELDEVAEATRMVERGLEPIRAGGYVEGLKNGAIAVARLRLAAGDAEGALSALAQAEDLVRKAGAPLAIAEVEAWRARALLHAGHTAQAMEWATKAAARPGDDRGFTREIEGLTLARVYLATGEPGKGLAVLMPWLGAAESDGRTGSAIEIRVLLALAHAGLGKSEAALENLGLALALAEPEGYARVFLDVGEPLAPLLERGLARRHWPDAAAEYAGLQLARSGRAAAKPVRKDEPARPAPVPASLPEPLSEREVEVLRLLAAGLSNQDIAERLVVSLNTVKKHTSNIFGKLDVASRTQAVARGRDLGLIQ